MKRVTVLATVKRDSWFFRVSTLECPVEEVYTIMIVVWNIKHRDRIYIRFFEEDAKAAAFVDECAAGKYGDVLEDEKDE